VRVAFAADHAGWLLRARVIAEISVAANKIPGIRACLCHDPFSAHQGVEDDDMNVICFGARVIGEELAADLLRDFLGANFSGAERHRRRVGKIAALEAAARGKGKG